MRYPGIAGRIGALTVAAGIGCAVTGAPASADNADTPGADSVSSAPARQVRGPRAATPQPSSTRRVADPSPVVDQITDIGPAPRSAAAVPIELIMNTPSHHRVHHGSNKEYLDKNYGGTLIVWDRLFRTFEPEVERVVYGLTRHIHTFNPAKVAIGEFISIGRGLISVRNWRDACGYMFRGPGWQPETR